jgi:diguanylate cyclase (GGDEF)-like protein
MIAFSLMSLIPLLVCAWLITGYIFPNINLFLGLSLGNISFILFISVVISLLGLYVIKEMIDPVIKIASEAAVMAGGDVEKKIEIEREDEIGNLSTSLNIMTQKIKENLEELNAYSEKTKLINLEINKKVLALSGLLQIGNLISSSTRLSTVLDFIAKKLSDVEEDAVTLIMMRDDEKDDFEVVSSFNIDETKLQGLKIKQAEVVPRILFVDRDASVKEQIIERVLGLLELKNIAMFPILVSGKQYGILVIGNDKSNFVFKDDQKELLKVFVKQATIAVENDLLIKKARELAITDELTGLYNQNFIHTRLDEEIKRACLYQRPCGYLLIDIDDFKMLHSESDESKTETLLKALGEILKASVTEVDKVGRLTADKFAIVLPERNKKQSASIAEEIRKRVDLNLSNIMNSSAKITVSIGVSENPIDGSSADELMEKAEKLVRNAKALGKNRVGV